MHSRWKGLRPAHHHSPGEAYMYCVLLILDKIGIIFTSLGRVRVQPCHVPFGCFEEEAIKQTCERESNYPIPPGNQLTLVACSQAILGLNKAVIIPGVVSPWFPGQWFLGCLDPKET